MKTSQLQTIGRYFLIVDFPNKLIDTNTGHIQIGFQDMQLVTTRTNAGQVPLCLYTSPGLDELNHYE